MDATPAPDSSTNPSKLFDDFATGNRKYGRRLAAILGALFVAITGIIWAVFQNVSDVVPPLALGGCALGALAMAYVDPIGSLLRGPPENVAGFYVHRLTVTALGAAVGNVTSIVLVTRAGRRYKVAVPESALGGWLQALRARFPSARESAVPGRVDVPFAPFAAFLGVWAAWALPIAFVAGTMRTSRHHHVYDEYRPAPAHHVVTPAYLPPLPTPAVRVDAGPPRPPAVTAARAGTRVDGRTAIHVGDTLRTEWHGSWYLAQVLAIGPDGVRVHYVGEGRATDETVARSRLRIPAL